MSEEELKIECLRLSLSPIRNEGETLQMAKQMYAWIKERGAVPSDQAKPAQA